MNTQNIKTIFSKELKSYFNSPIAYIVMIVFMAISGFLFTMSFFQINIASMREFFGSFFIQLVLFVVFIPAITMRSFSEEKKQGTLELLLTKPVTDLELILGKYLSALTLIVITLSPTILYFIIIKMIGPIPFWPFLTSLLGYILMSAFFYRRWRVYFITYRKPDYCIYSKCAYLSVLFPFRKITYCIPSFGSFIF
ncbi:MAG: ABC-2 family transporter protein [Chlorobi bacterium OLB5]|nr:MAG: ABC-2 family transporter protein [Chlorobi bacterium OLB5]